MLSRFFIEISDLSVQERVYLCQLCFQFFAYLGRFFNQQRAGRFAKAAPYAAHYALQTILETLQVVDVILAARLYFTVVERLLD